MFSGLDSCFWSHFITLVHSMLWAFSLHAMVDHVVHCSRSWFVRPPQGYKIGNVLSPLSKHNV